MKMPKPDQETKIVKHLSPGERKIFHTGIRNRDKYWRRMKRLRAIRNGLRRTILFLLCIGLFIAGTAANSVAAGSQPGCSAPALFNDANAALRAGRLGPAILGYERAKLIEPGDPSVAQNLRIAREKAGVAAPAVPVWKRPAFVLSFDGFAAVAAVSLSVLCLLFFGWHLIPAGQRRHARPLAMSLGAAGIFATLALAVRWPELDRAVIIGAHAVARIAPAGDSDVAFDLKSGDLVQAEGSYGQFEFVRASDGRSGWVSRPDIERIIPSGS